MPADIESDPLFTLLTDALRAGPNSPQWNEALTALRERGAEGSDEHQLLLDARQDLAAGKEYRSVSAGPGFTRKLMADIESDNAAARSGPSTATVVAVVCGLLVLAVAAYVIYRATSTPLTGPAAVDKLENDSHRFFEPLASASFNGAIPPDWNAIGSLKLEATDGLRPVADQENKNLGGGLVWKKSVAGNSPFAVELTVHTGSANAGVLLEAFVSADSHFSPEKGTNSRDLVWQTDGKQQHVLLSGSGQTVDPAAVFHDGQVVRLIVGPYVAIVELVSGGKTTRLWSGAHDLGADARYAGIRFLQTGAGKPDVSVSQIKVTTAQQ